MADYLSTDFGLSMVPIDCIATIRQISLTEVPYKAESIIRRNITALIVSALLGRKIITTKRHSTAMKAGDNLYCLIPNFFCTELYDFSVEEIVKAGYKVYAISMEDKI